MNKFIDYLSKKDNYTFNKSKILKYKVIDLKLDSSFREKFPELSLLFETAITIEISTKTRGKEVIYWLLCWDIDGYIYEIVCLPPNEEDTLNVETYTIFKENLGGILEVYHDKEYLEENDFYLINKTKILCVNAVDSKEYLKDIEDVLEDYEDEPDYNLESINLKTLFVVDVDGNGDVTVCDKKTEEIYLFSHDNCCDFIQECPGYPEYTFYKITDCDTLQKWIEIFGMQLKNIMFT